MPKKVRTKNLKHPTGCNLSHFLDRDFLRQSRASCATLNHPFHFCPSTFTANGTSVPHLNHKRIATLAETPSLTIFIVNISTFNTLRIMKMMAKENLLSQDIIEIRIKVFMVGKDPMLAEDGPSVHRALEQWLSCAWVWKSNAPHRAGSGTVTACVIRYRAVKLLLRCWTAMLRLRADDGVSRALFIHVALNANKMGHQNICS